MISCMEVRHATHGSTIRTFSFIVLASDGKSGKLSWGSIACILTSCSCTAQCLEVIKLLDLHCLLLVPRKKTLICICSKSVAVTAEVV